jgi:hypothetical protein
VANYNSSDKAIAMCAIIGLSILTAESALGLSGGELGLDQRWRRAADYFFE